MKNVSFVTWKIGLYENHSNYEKYEVHCISGRNTGYAVIKTLDLYTFKKKNYFIILFCGCTDLSALSFRWQGCHNLGGIGDIESMEISQVEKYTKATKWL